MFRTVPLSIISSFSLYTHNNGICHIRLLTASSQAVSKPVCIAVCKVNKLLMMDIGTVRNT